MISYRKGIDLELALAALKQVEMYLTVKVRLRGLPKIHPEEYGAEALFGGEGDMDEDFVKKRLLELASKVSEEIVRVKGNYGDLVLPEGSEDLDPAKARREALETFGYQDLFDSVFPGSI